ncbi:ISL3 family transposase, partial [Halolactibacillus miurensis]
DAGGEKFQTVIVDADNRKVIDVLPDRKKETITSYLRSCDTGQVRAVVMDLSRGFKEAVREILGNPIIIADRFHYMRQVYNAFDEVRRDVQNELSDEERKHMKRSKEMLWKSSKKITSETKEKADKMLSISSKLKHAYELKDELDDRFKNSDLHTAKERFEKCIEKLGNSPYESFNRVARTFERWRLEINNSFSHLYNNGVTEGINNMIKVIKRHSFGIKDFQRFRKKILWYQEVKEMRETL